MSQDLTWEICNLAWDIVLPSIKRADSVGIMDECVGTIVILDPQSGDVLFLGCLGGGAGIMQRNKTALFAAKTYWRIQSAGNDPTTLAGDGVAGRNGVVVAFNGTQPARNQVIAQNVLSWILLLMQPDGPIFDALGAEAEQRMAEAGKFPEKK